MAQDGSAGSPRYKQFDDLVFERPYRSDLDDTLLGTEAGPDMRISRATANGEAFDPNGLNAAHKYLPLPTFVKVTNLKNRRSIILRVNDRGPFVDGRIIDLSAGAALKLGFYKQGTTRVRVETIPVEG